MDVLGSLFSEVDGIAGGHKQPRPAEDGSIVARFFSSRTLYTPPPLRMLRAVRGDDGCGAGDRTDVDSVEDSAMLTALQRRSVDSARHGAVLAGAGSAIAGTLSLASASSNVPVEYVQYLGVV